MSKEQRRTILIMHGDPLTLQFVGFSLRSAGFIVYTCELWAKVPGLLRRTSPEVVLLQYNMPSLRGDQVCQILKTNPANRNLKVIFYDSVDPATMKQVVRDCGADGFIQNVPGKDPSAELKTLLATEPAPAEPSPAGASIAGPARVLVVDDSSLFRRMVRQALFVHFRSEVTEARDGAEALSLISEKTFDLVMLDVNMPQMNGLQFLDHFRQLPATRPPVIMCSTEGQEDDVLRGLSSGAQGYLIKPFTPDSLCSIVCQVLARNI